MHIRQTLIRALALALTLLLVLGSTNPALAVQEAGMTVTKIDNDALDARLEQPIVAEPGEEAPYGDTDMVRVSILLEKKSTLEAGFSTTGITQNDAAMAYRETLRADQETVTAQISQALGEKLEVHWNMTLAANIISAGLQYGQIETVKAVPGVKDVILRPATPHGGGQAGGGRPQHGYLQRPDRQPHRRTLPGTPARVCALL
ncbi:MAG: hypothetical protein ACLSHU_13355 [Oscillospiraceae bacterium]